VTAPGPQLSRVLAAVLRIGLGVLFVVAGAVKWADPTAFAQEIANYQLLPGLAPHLAVLLPAIEITAGAVLLAGPLVWRRAAAAALFLVTAAFTVAVTAAVLRGLDISCGCFGGDSAKVTWLTVLRNLALLAAAAYLAWSWRSEPPPAPTAGPLEQGA
jgi:putative oxidoreductase